MNTAIVTGAGKRLGKAIAIYLAKKGYNLILHYNSSKEGVEDTKKIIHELGRESFIVQADLLYVHQIENMFKVIKKNFEKVEVLVNNAGLFPQKKPIQEVDETLWHNIIDLNLKSLFFTSKEFMNVASTQAKIVNIASLGGLEIWQQRIPYNISKTGAIQLTKALSRELAPNIAVNAVCPGQIVFEDDPKKHDKTLIDINKIPMGRFGKPVDVAEAVWFFIQATHYITGQYLVIDGGYHFAH